jgi:hypothetical protein
VRYEVLEAPGGAPLGAWMREHKQLDWPSSLNLLASVADELESTERESPAQRFAPEQIWIDRWGNVRLLDAALDAAAPAALSATQLLGWTATQLVPAGGLLPRSLPGGAEAVFERLLERGRPYASAAEARAALAAIETSSSGVERKQRGIQLAIAGGILGFAALLLLGVLLLRGVFNDEQARGHVYLKDLALGRSTVTQEALDAEDVRARQVALRQITIMPWSADFEPSLDAAERELYEQARRAVPSIDTALLKSAQERLESRHARPPGNVELVLGGQRPKERSAVGILAIGWLALALLGALALRGGLTLRVFGMILRDGRGRRAGRLRCALRSLCAWSPLLLMLIPGLGWASAWWPVIGAFALLALGAAYALWHPSRGLPDLAAGTWIAPR